MRFRCFNTDFKCYASLDDGTDYDQITLTDQGEYTTGKDIYSGTVTLTDTADQTMRWKCTTHNTKELRVHGLGLFWE